MRKIFLEYIWLDGSMPVTKIRSKTRILITDKKEVSLSDFPEWTFDGSSTNQAHGHDSDCLLHAVSFVNDPLRSDGYLVMCEVLNPDGTLHESNTRAKLRQALALAEPGLDPWAGYEQEYTMFKRNIPLGWPEHGYPAPQGPYYCGVGSEQIFGRNLAERHAELCLRAGLLYHGLNAEVMPGQWEFQIGYRGVATEDAGILNAADHLWIARWLLHRISEESGIHISLDNKPVKGDWNGAGLHTNFSTAHTRDPKEGMQHMELYIKRLEAKHQQHIVVYGDKLHERLTGTHETCSIHEFRAGAADRGSSIRIPRHIAERGYGYLEDRRPGANADPYVVGARLVATISEIDETVLSLPQSEDSFERVA